MKLALFGLVLLTACAQNTVSRPPRMVAAPAAGQKKQLDLELMELALDDAARGSDRAMGMAQKMLLNNLALIDKESGGAHDYSLIVPGRHPWRTPSPGKSLRTQAINLRLYSRAHELFGGHYYLDAARSVYRYLATDLAADEGGFHDENTDRVPTVENAMAIAALVAFYEATHEAGSLERAMSAADRLLVQRSDPSGGFRDDGECEVSRDATEAMIQAMSALHRAKADPRYGVTRDRASKFLSANDAMSALMAGQSW